jgi:dTDP-glucose pyrophosphorylase
LAPKLSSQIPFLFDGKALDLVYDPEFEKSRNKRNYNCSGRKKGRRRRAKNYKFPNLKIKYLIQKEPKGMGNALWQARNLVKGPFFVLIAEEGIDCEKIIKVLWSKSKNSKAKVVLTGQKTENPQAFWNSKIKRG